MRLRSFSWLALLAIIGSLLLPAVGWAHNGDAAQTGESQIEVPGGDGATTPSATPKATLPDIEDEVMCTVCGTLLALATESPQANRERDLIRRLIAQGQTKDQIKDHLVDEFGPNVLATPSTSGFDITAWLVPGLAVVAAAIGIFLGLRRWRKETDERDASKPAPSALNDEDAKRLDTDLAKYEL